MDTAPLEHLIRRDRAVVALAMAALVVLSGAWVVSGAGMGMTAAEMTKMGLFPHAGGRVLAPMGDMGGWVPAPALADPASFALIVSMWWVMMVAMMLPSATPMMLLHARTVRHAQSKGRMPAGPILTGWLLAGYLTAWLGFSLAAGVLQGLLQSSGAISVMMLWSESRWLSTAVLLTAALYQVTPWKRACLEHCRTPAEYLSRHWRHGQNGAFRMGLEHGAYCVGCCWVLMHLLFVGGVMNLIWIAALALFVLAEKATPLGRGSGWISALILGVWAGATLAV